MSRNDRFSPVRAAMVACIAVGLFYLVPSGADGSAQADAGPARIEPKADEILKRMSRSLAGARTVRFRAYDMADQMMDNGQKLQFSRALDVCARRPDAVYATVKGDTEDMQFCYNASKLTVINHRERCYAMHDVPRSIDEMFDFIAEKYGITAPLADLLFSDAYAAMTGRVRSGQYVGLHSVGQTACHHLAFRQDGIDWQIWIEDSEQSVPRKIVITYKDLPGQPQFVALLDAWNLAPELAPSVFEVNGPSGYKRIDLQELGHAHYSSGQAMINKGMTPSLHWLRTCLALVAGSATIGIAQYQVNKQIYGNTSSSVRYGRSYTPNYANQPSYNMMPSENRNLAFRSGALPSTIRMNQASIGPLAPQGVTAYIPDPVSFRSSAVTPGNYVNTSTGLRVTPTPATRSPHFASNPAATGSVRYSGSSAFAPTGGMPMSSSPTMSSSPKMSAAAASPTPQSGSVRYSLKF